MSETERKGAPDRLSPPERFVAKRVTCLPRWWITPLLVMVAWTMPACFSRESQEDLVPVRRAWTVMGTSLKATIYRPETAAAVAQADLDAIYEEMLRIDHLMSLYRPDSELVGLNSRSGSGPTQVSAPTYQILQASRHYARLSGGALDVTVQPLVDLWGFYTMERTAIPAATEIEQMLNRIGLDRFHLDEVARTVDLASGSRIDLGSIAKGYAIDRALATLRTREVPAALIDLGGNIGVLNQPPTDRSWTVGLQHPRRNELIGLLHLQEGAVATSGDYDRYFEVDDQRFSHLLDPRTGWPARDLQSVTVIAPSATAADALSTAAFVLGPKDGLELLSRCTGVEALLIPSSKEGGPDGEGSMPLAVILTPGLIREEGGAFAIQTEMSGGSKSGGDPADAATRMDCNFPIGP